MRASTDAFRLFMERNAQLLAPDGVTGVVVPSAFHANEGARAYGAFTWNRWG